MININMTDFLKLLQNESSPKSKPKFSALSTFLICATGGTAAVITFVTVPFITPAFRKVCLPYVPASSAQVTNVLQALRNRSGNLVDLGSGDGRIVQCAAKMGFNAVGVDLNYWLVLYSRFTSLCNGCFSNTKYYRRDLWTFDLNPFTNVVLFGTEQMMPDIETKILNELNDGSVVVTCRFPLPNLTPQNTIGEGIDTVWKYDIRKKMKKET